jgi:heme exporter protein C
MADKLVYAAVALSAVVLTRNLWLIFMVVPDEAAQGMIYRLLYFHVPAWWTAFAAVALSATFSALFLVKRSLRFDALAVCATEVAVVFLIVGITLGSIWARIIWGVWWAWDARLTSAVVCVLLYSGYLALRRAIEGPERRARLSAVFSLIAVADVPVVWFSIRWWRTQHPQPMQLPPEMWRALLWNWFGMALLAAALMRVCFDLGESERRLASIRRHWIAAMKER